MSVFPLLRNPRNNNSALVFTFRHNTTSRGRAGREPSGASLQLSVGSFTLGDLVDVTSPARAVATPTARRCRSLRFNSTDNSPCLLPYCAIDGHCSLRSSIMVSTGSGRFFYPIVTSASALNSITEGLSLPYYSPIRIMRSVLVYTIFRHTLLANDKLVVPEYYIVSTSRQLGYELFSFRLMSYIVVGFWSIVHQKGGNYFIFLLVQYR